LLAVYRWTSHPDTPSIEPADYWFRRNGTPTGDRFLQLKCYVAAHPLASEAARLAEQLRAAAPNLDIWNVEAGIATKSVEIEPYPDRFARAAHEATVAAPRHCRHFTPWLADHELATHLARHDRDQAEQRTNRQRFLNAAFAASGALGGAVLHWLFRS
jgi:arylsulfatase A-like enzyme